MRKAIVLSIVISWLLIPGLAMSQPSSNPDDWTGNVNIFLGAKILDKDDWDPVDEHFEAGVLIDFKQKSWPISIAIDFLRSSDEEDVSVAVLNFGTFSFDLEGNTTEFNLGVRKIWDNPTVVHPFVGGGLAVISAEVKGTALGVSVPTMIPESGYGLRAVHMLPWASTLILGLKLDGQRLKSLCSM
jgi:hypothetical protein